MATIPQHITNGQAIAELTGYEDAATLAWEQACATAALELRASPASPLHGIDQARFLKGVDLAQRGAVADGQVGSDKTTYPVSLEPMDCTCKDFDVRGKPCKHLAAAHIALAATARYQAPLVEPDEPVGDAQSTVQDGTATRRAPLHTTASWPTSEAPASMNIKLKVGNVEFMYTLRDVDDEALRSRAAVLLPWLQDILAEAEEDLAQRTQAAASLAAAQARAQAPAAPSSNGSSPPPAADQSICALHNAGMRWHAPNEKGPGWWSHQLADSSYCKGK